jgi:hypothetical protein
MNKRHLYILTLSLISIGIGLFLYKYFKLGFPLKPDTMVDVWNVEVRITFDAQNKTSKVTLYVPVGSSNFVVTTEHFVSGRYGLTSTKEDGNKKAMWSIRKIKGRQTLYYRAVIHSVKAQNSEKAYRPKIKEPELEEPYLSAARSLNSEIFNQSADMDTLIAELLKRLNATEPDEDVALLLHKRKTILSKLQMAVKLLALEQIPARIVHGIELKEQTRDAQFIEWLEIYFQDAWHPFNPITGTAGIPQSYLVWWRGSAPPYHVTNGENTRVNVAVTLNQEEAISAVIGHSRFNHSGFLEFSLFSLPIQTQMLYRILLLIPVGAFFVVLLRNVIGIKTFGTFMPVLIALAFRESELIGGIILFTVVISLGLSIRFYLEHLKLLIIPRLAAMLTSVILLMAVLSVLTHKLGIERGLSLALFPMVIMTMTIERMSVVWEEQSPGEAIKQGIGSLLTAALVYVVIINDYIEHIVFVFPELLLVLLAFILLLGRYTGYRLLELQRFKTLSIRKL